MTILSVMDLRLPEIYHILRRTIFHVTKLILCIMTLIPSQVSAQDDLSVSSLERGDYSQTYKTIGTRLNTESVILILMH